MAKRDEQQEQIAEQQKQKTVTPKKGRRNGSKREHTLFYSFVNFIS